MTTQDVAFEMNSLISLEMMESQIAEVKWQHLTIKDKVAMFTVKGSRNVINNKNALAHRNLWSWLIDHDVPWSEIDGQACSTSGGQKPDLSHACCPVFRLKIVHKCRVP